MWSRRRSETRGRCTRTNVRSCGDCGDRAIIPPEPTASGESGDAARLYPPQACGHAPPVSCYGLFYPSGVWWTYFVASLIWSKRGRSMMLLLLSAINVCCSWLPSSAATMAWSCEKISRTCDGLKLGMRRSRAESLLLSRSPAVASRLMRLPWPVLGSDASASLRTEGDGNTPASMSLTPALTCFYLAWFFSFVVRYACTANSLGGSSSSMTPAVRKLSIVFRN